MRVLITGLGGELGTRVALLLEELSEIDAIVGLDAEPPRRRLHRTDFHRIHPRDHHGSVALVKDFEPTAVVHLGTYEPNARCSPRSAQARTAEGTGSVLEAAAMSPGLDRIVLRSGIEVYGRGRGAPECPDEATTPAPTSPFGRSLLAAEDVARVVGQTAGVAVTSLRLAPVVGPHFPSPLGRYLRLPVVPVSATSSPPFSLLHQEDAAEAIVAAFRRPHDGPLNVVADGVVNGWEAVRIGGRIPLPTLGPGWSVAKAVTEIAGSPLPDHVRELLSRGRTADGRRVGEVLEVAPRWSTREVVEDLFQWASVTIVEFGEAQSGAA